MGHHISHIQVIFGNMSTYNNVFCNKFVTMWWRRGILNNDIPPGHVGDRGGGGGDQHVNPGSQ